MSYQDIIYLDHCSTTPMGDDAATALRKNGVTIFGNPSASHHTAGAMASELLEASRAQAAEILGAPYDGLIFTSCATEANNLVLQGFVLKNRRARPRLVVSAIEHKSVYETAQFCATHLDATTDVIGVNKNGSLKMDQLREVLARDQDRPTLVAIMHMNNEIPVLNPIEEIAELCEKYGYFLHVDAVQSYVRRAINLRTINANSIVVSPHKFYGPKAFGILALRDGAKDAGLVATLHGGTQEFGFRAGTPNAVMASAAAASMVAHEKNRDTLNQYAQNCQDQFIDELNQQGVKWHLTVPTSKDCPGILSLWFENHAATDIMAALPDVCINRGSSCIGAGGDKHSHVYSALGYEVEVAANILRVSFGFRVTPELCRVAARKIAGVIR